MLPFSFAGKVLHYNSIYLSGIRQADQIFPGYTYTIQFGLCGFNSSRRGPLLAGFMMVTILSIVLVFWCYHFHGLCWTEVDLRKTGPFIPFPGGGPYDMEASDWLWQLSNDVQCHLVVVVKYISTERSHMQLQFFIWSSERQHVSIFLFPPFLGIVDVSVATLTMAWQSRCSCQVQTFPRRPPTSARLAKFIRN